ncbi:MAG: hypothetical protein N2383_03305 [Caldilineales bacterium]|nr:hypothetical protein [Caldilineales bacterium]
MRTGSKKTLEAQLRTAEAKAAHKRAVLARHAPGTPWHTRAQLELRSIERRIADLRRQLFN